MSSPTLTTSQDILDLIAVDPWMMGVLRTVRELRLPDWWVAAGFVRAKVWDTLHGYMQHTSYEDVDVIYFAPSPTGALSEQSIMEQLTKMRPDVTWEVTNQATVHRYNQEAPYTSSTDALSRWPETATCIGAQLTNADEVLLTAPHGVDDLLNLVIRLNPKFSRGKEIFLTRINKKQWQKKWPKLSVVE